jgi:hypothetical protein
MVYFVIYNQFIFGGIVIRFNKKMVDQIIKILIE